MISVPAVKLSQFGTTFYQAALSARDVEQLVRFEVLSYETPRLESKRRASPARKINWEVLESKISQSSEAYQRPIIRKKIEELVQYYRDRHEHRDLPAIPGAVLLVSEQPLEFRPAGKNARAGSLEIPDVGGVLRTLDGQHRVLALYAYAAQQGMDSALADLQIPAVIFDSLRPAHAVEMFVTINTKHTRLRPDLIVSLAGRKLYPERRLATAHDIIRALNELEASPLHGQIRILGVGPGKLSQSPLAAEMDGLFTMFEAAGGRAAEEFYADGKRFFVAYFRQISKVFPAAWDGRKYSLKTGSAFRAFIRVIPDVLMRLRKMRVPIYDQRAIAEILIPWQARIGDKRFETEGQWRQKSLTGGSRTVEILTAELRDALA